MKKILLSIILILISTGCSVKYNIKIDRNMKIKETVTGLETAEFFAQYEKSSIRRVISFILEPHLEYLNNNNYSVNNVLGTESGVEITKEYQNFDSYIKNLDTNDSLELNERAYQSLGSNFNYMKEGNIVTIQFNGKLPGDDTQNQEVFRIDDADISITLPFVVEEHNADSYDKKTNTYTWRLDRENPEKEILIKFDKSKLKIDYLKYIILGVVIFVGIFIIYQVYNFIQNIRNNNSKRNEI